MDPFFVWLSPPFRFEEWFAVRFTSFLFPVDSEIAGKTGGYRKIRLTFSYLDRMMMMFLSRSDPTGLISSPTSSASCHCKRFSLATTYAP
jgi:hypothetical protein